MDNDQKLFEYQPLISVSSGNLQREREMERPKEMVVIVKIASGAEAEGEEC